MTEEFYTEEVIEEKPKNRGLMIAGIVAAILLLCCCGSIALLWFTGDSIVNFLESASLLLA